MRNTFKLATLILTTAFIFGCAGQTGFKINSSLNKNGEVELDLRQMEVEIVNTDGMLVQTQADVQQTEALEFKGIKDVFKLGKLEDKISEVF